MRVKEIVRNYLQKLKIGDDIWYYLHLTNVSIRQLIPDDTFLSNSYRKTHGKNIDLNNPKTFDEKQIWLKLNYRNPLCVQCSDKYMVRKYVKNCGLEYILNPVYAVYNSVDDIEWSKLPSRFYIKTNHMSACNACCDDPQDFDRKEAIKRLKRGMRHDYSMDSREWNYKPIKRKIIVEAIIEDQRKSPLIDYRFLCYNGKCEYVFVDIGTAGKDGKHLADAKRNVYDRDMNLLNVTVSRKRFDPHLVSKPMNYDKMVDIAETLSGNFPFCRVDLYNVDGKIVFGEITFFHAGGLSRIEPSEWEYRLGKDISIELAKQQIANNYKDFKLELYGFE